MIPLKNPFVHIKSLKGYKSGWIKDDFLCFIINVLYELLKWACMFLISLGKKVSYTLFLQSFQCLVSFLKGLPRWYSTTCQCKRCRFDPWVEKIPWSRKWQPAPVFLPGKFHGQRSLVGYSPWGHKKSDTTEQLSTAQHYC